MPQVRKRFPDSEIRVRLDADFASPRVFKALEEHKCKYLVGLPKNSRLDGDTDTDQVLTCLSAYLSGESERDFGELQYKTKNWKVTRRVIYKVEALMYDGRSQRENRRYVVTNLEESRRKSGISMQNEAPPRTASKNSRTTCGWTGRAVVGFSPTSCGS
jgi:Transposase DDE domain group 1